MKYILTIFWITSLFCIGCINAREVERKNEKRELGYYENMSAMTLVYGAELFNREDTTQEKQKIARELSYVIFTYWTHTRLGDLSRSSKVDRGAKKTYKIYFSENEEIIRIFKDPLGWLESDKPTMSPPKNNTSLTKDEYLKLLNRYHSFLGIN